jgi:hypothetical protein
MLCGNGDAEPPFRGHLFDQRARHLGFVRVEFIGNRRHHFNFSVTS